MTSESLKWVIQTAFDGGIQQQPEIAHKNNVLDALNVWTPLSRAERRPGFSTVPFGITSPTTLTSTTTLALYDATGALVQSGNAGTTWIWPTVTAGSTFTVTIPGVDLSLSVLRTAGLASPGFFPPFFMNVMGVPTKRGVVILDAYVTSNDVISGTWANFFVLPADTVFGSGGSITIIFYITALTSATLLPPISANSWTIATKPVSTTVPTIIKRIEYADGTRYLLVNSTSFYQDTNLQFKTLNGIPDLASQAEFPGQIAVIPELNLAYYVFGGSTVLLTLANNPVNDRFANLALVQDGTIVGAPPSVMACYNSFPGGTQIINFRGHLFANGSTQNGQQSILFWNFGNLSEDASGDIIDTSNIWPTTAFATLSDARDNSEITTLFPVGDNLGVAKKNSIWLAVLAKAATPGAISGGVVTQNATLVDQFVVQLVVPGVGCLAPGSAQAIPGGTIFLAEDGFYLFDGTPNIKPLSYGIQDYINRINPSRKSFAQAVNWRTKRMYLCAVSLDESITNNALFVYDYQSGAWWILQGYDINAFLTIDGIGLREELWFQDSASQFNKIIGDTDYGTPIESFLLTQRFGEFDTLSRDVTEIRAQSINNQNTDTQPSVELLIEDIPVTTQDDTSSAATNKPIVFPLDGEVLWSLPPVSGVSAYAPERRRERKVSITGSGKWMQAKLQNFTQYIMAAIGYTPNSRR